MAAKVVGASRFRHTKGSINGKDVWYTELSPSATSDANVLAVSASHLGLVLSSSGGGDVGVLPLSATGKRKDQQLQVVHAHSGKQIFDIQFSPFEDNVFGTSGDEKRRERRELAIAAAACVLWDYGPADLELGTLGLQRSCGKECFSLSRR